MDSAHDTLRRARHPGRFTTFRLFKIEHSQEYPQKLIDGLRAMATQFAIMVSR
jgi:hypothetical protein